MDVLAFIDARRELLFTLLSVSKSGEMPGDWEKVKDALARLDVRSVGDEFWAGQTQALSAEVRALPIYSNRPDTRQMAVGYEPVIRKLERWGVRLNGSMPP